MAASERGQPAAAAVRVATSGVERVGAEHDEGASGALHVGGGMEEAATKRAAKGAGRAMRQPDPIPYQGHGVSHAPLEEWSGGKSHYSPVPKCIASLPHRRPVEN